MPATLCPYRQIRHYYPDRKQTRDVYVNRRDICLHITHEDTFPSLLRPWNKQQQRLLPALPPLRLLHIGRYSVRARLGTEYLTYLVGPSS